MSTLLRFTGQRLLPLPILMRDIACTVTALEYHNNFILCCGFPEAGAAGCGEEVGRRSQGQGKLTCAFHIP